MVWETGLSMQERQSALRNRNGPGMEWYGASGPPAGMPVRHSAQDPARAPQPNVRHSGGDHFSRPGDSPAGSGGYGRPGDAPNNNMSPPTPEVRDVGGSAQEEAYEDVPWFLPEELHRIYVDALIETGSADAALRAVRENPLYEQFFPGNYNADSGLVAMTEVQYRAYQQEVRNLMGKYQMADHFGTDAYIGQFVAGGLSFNEIEERLQYGFQAAATADPNTVAELENMYGASAADLAAFYLDPDVATETLERRFRSAQLSGIGISSGFGDLSRGQAEGLYGYGVSDQQAREGFSALVQQRQLFTPLMGTRGSSINRQEQLDAAFASDADALMEIQRERSRRTAEFQGGGGPLAGTGRLDGFRRSSSL